MHRTSLYIQNSKAPREKNQPTKTKKKNTIETLLLMFMVFKCA